MEKTNNPIKRWFADRLEHRIDRLWLGGVLCVSLLVTVLLDFRFIAIFLIGYFFAFVWYGREQIQGSFQPRETGTPKAFASSDIISATCALYLVDFVSR